MTIEEAIEELGTLYVPRDGEQDRLADAQEMAIRSLEAWEKVKADIKDIKDLYDLGKEDLSTKMFIEGVETVEHIIDTYLKGVRE